MASSHPNVQNLPRARDYRACFRPPAGYVWIKADYSQIEARVTAVLAHDEAMLAVFRDSQDIHRRTAAAVFGVPEAEISKEDRRRAKAIVFGFLFGMSATTFVEYARTTYGVALPLARHVSSASASSVRSRLKRWH